MQNVRIKTATRCLRLRYVRAFSDTAEEITLFSNTDLAAHDSLSTTFISGDAPTFISSAAHPAKAIDVLGPSENTALMTLPAYRDDQPALVLDDSESAEDEEERKRRALLPGVSLVGLLGSGTLRTGHVPTVQGTSSLSGVPEVQGIAPTPGGMPAGNPASPPAPTGSSPSHGGPGHDAHTTLSHSTPTDHLEHEHHYGSEHHHEPGRRHEHEHHHESAHRHE